MSASRTAMDNEKAAVKRSMAEEARFREEKQRIVESLGGSRAELVTPSANARLQRKLNEGSNPTHSSLVSQSSVSGFQANSRNARPEQPAPIDDRPPIDDVPLSLDFSDEQNDHSAGEQRRQPKRRTSYIIVGVILVVAIGGIVGVVVAFVNRAAAPSTTSEGTDSTTDEESCKLDREAIAKCENGLLTVPQCATDIYQELVESYSSLLDVGENECDAAHQGLVALAVAQINHGADVADPVMFFAMSTLYFALKGTHWRVDTNWLKGSSPCSGFWYGIECSLDEPLISILLEKNNLEGFLPTEVGLLSNLKFLSVGLNEISGTIPSEIGRLAKLQLLDFRFSSIHSKLPSEFGELTELIHVNLGGTPLTGTIPSEIGNWIKLESLEFQGNQFTGTLPTELGNLVELRNLVLAYMSGLSGTVPLDLIALTKLERFMLLLFSLDPSPFPQVFPVATNLKLIDFRETHLTGSLPSTLANLSNLQQLTLTDLQMTGTIPTEIGLLTNLVYMGVHGANLQGTIPSEVGRLTRLTSLSILKEPKINGPIPSELGALTSLELLDFRDNGLRGTIPFEVCALGLSTGTFRFDECSAAGSDESCMTNTCSI